MTRSKTLGRRLDPRAEAAIHASIVQQLSRGSAQMEIAENDRILIKPEVKHITRLSETTLWREVKAKRFPPAVQISPNRIGWLESAVREWMRERVQEAYRREEAA